MKKQWLYTFLFTVLLSIGLVTKAQAFDVGDGLQYPENNIIEAYQDKSTGIQGYLTNIKNFNYTPITVTPKTPGKIIKSVTLKRKTDNSEYAKLVNVGGDQWKIETITGDVKSLTREAVPYGGYFEWFRDPNKYIWMYDIDSQRHHFSTWDKFEDHPVSVMMVVDSPTQKYGQVDPESHIATIYHNASIPTTSLKLDERDDVLIPLEKASNVHVLDNEIKYSPESVIDLDGRNYLISEDDIIDKRSVSIDITNGNYQFYVTAKFDNYGFKPISDSESSGRVIKWWDGWKFTLRGEVYFVPDLKIEAEEADPPNQADLTVESIVMNGCPEVGTEGLFTYTILNKGSATTKDFKVQIRVDGTEIATHTFTGGLGQNAKKTGTVRYTFPAAGEKTFSVFVDSNNDILESDEDSNVLHQTFKPCDPDEPPPKPPDLKITGDFTFSKPSIYFGENNNVFPVGITVTGGNGCTYVSHNFTFTQGSKFFAPRDNLSPKDKSYFFQYDSGFKEYGGGIKTGTVSVKMKINTSCGITEEVGPKTFEIVTDPSQHPPYLEIAWYINGVEISDSVPEGTVVELRVKKETDADNDLDTREWFFDESTSWVRSLPAQYGWSKPYDKKGYYYITANTQGFHKVCAQAEDLRGNVSNKACAFLDVIGPNPIPVISGATSVKVNRPLTPTLDSLKSYSPVPGRTIDHARDEWSSTAVWSDGTTSSWGGYSNSFSKAGKVTVSLDVFDNTGLKSVAPDTHVITVLPDDPPVIEFEYLSVMTRSAQTFRNASYSPDGDGIETYRVTVGYEWSNNGVFNIYESEVSTNNSGFTFHPTRVGKYHFRVYAKEPQVYGKDAYKDYVVEVINDNPEVTFTVTGEATEPNPINVAGLNPNDLMWWTNTSLDKWSMTNSWVVGPDGSLVSGKRIPGTTSFFSVPIGDANIKLQGKQLQLGGTNIPLDRTGFTPIGNEAFIGLNSSNYMYVVSPNFAPKSLGEKVYTANMYVNYATDELMVLNIQTGTSSIYIEKWTKYRLSDLRNGNVVVASSGTREVRYFSGGQYYTETGQVGTWSDGTRPGNYSRVRFRDDYKEVNLTTRTVKSYYPWDLINPYKTESYNTIPSFKGLRFSSQTTLTWYPNEYPDAIFAPTSDGRTYSNVPMDAKGNYYMYVRESWDSYIVKIDGFTGIPISTSKINHDFFGQDVRLVSISEDGNIAELSSYQTYYFDLRSGNQSGAAPKFMSNFDSSSYQNGYGFKTIDEPTTYWDDDCGCWLPTTTRVNRLHELSNNQRVWDNTVGAGTIVSENQYIEGGYLYKYNPSENQPAASNEPFTFGQLINTSSQQITNGTILWSMKTRLDQVNMTAGMGFRIQNYQNMYRLESHKSKLNLVKIVNGRKIVISSVNRTAVADTWVPYRIKINGSNMKVYENNSLIMDEWDDTFWSGTMGPFSTADSSQFKGMSFQWSNTDSSYATPGTAIVDTNVKYDPTYNDEPENDPRLDIRTQWSYQHVDTTKFLDYGDGKSGLSSLHGRTITSPSLTFDKVGVYKIDYRVPDDPHQDHRIANGDLMFEGYSKYSDWYTQYLIVHRRPISLFNIWQDGGNRTVLWSDSSYDPDHCYNSGNCQNQSDYPTSHGVYKKKFYYITPSGSRVDGKLIRPTESGTYVVAMAVADEYNAWSDWYEVTIDICNGCQAAPNNPPGVYLTFPSGTQDNPSPVSLRPTIYWNQWDPDPGTVYETFDLNIKEEWGACVECVTNKFMGTTAGNWAWTMDVQLTQGRKYSAQVRINDGETWSAWSNVGWMVTNSPPAAYMSYPWGSQDNPTIVNTRRPTLTWTQSDPDAGAWLDYYQILIINEANNYTIYDSSKVWQHTQSNSGSLVVPVDLPTGQKMRVKVKVWDQYGAESNWSPDVWMMINRPPIAQFTWKVNPPTTVFEGPAWEGDHIQIINQSSDPDNDPISSAWSIKDPYGNVSTYTTDPYLTFVQPGNYEVTLTVTDQQGASDTVTRIIPVSPMVLLGYVNHTDEWNKNRIQYNQSKTNTDDKPRGYEVFFPGEIFLLKADTTGNVIKTESQILGTSFHTNMTKISGSDFNGVWTGSIWDESMLDWDNQTITFRFTSTTPTGYKKTTDVQIIIDDDEYWRQKRSR